MSETFVVVTGMTLEEALEAVEEAGGDRWFTRLEYGPCGSHAVHAVWGEPEVVRTDYENFKPAPASAPVFDHDLLDLPEEPE